MRFIRLLNQLRDNLTKSNQRILTPLGTMLKFEMILSRITFITRELLGKSTIIGKMTTAVTLYYTLSQHGVNLLRSHSGSHESAGLWSERADEDAGVTLLILV